MNCFMCDYRHEARIYAFVGLKFPVVRQSRDLVRQIHKDQTFLIPTSAKLTLQYISKYKTV